MTPRERFLETLLFGRPDKIPFQPGGPRESTRAAWRVQGMPADRDYMDLIHEMVDAERAQRGLPPGDYHAKKPHVGLGVSFRMIPTFEEKVIEHKDGHYIVQDWMGAITEISDRFDYTYIRNAIDFVTRKWHRFPVQTWDDWEDMKRRFDPDHPERFPEDFDERCAQLRERDYPLGVSFNGPFWQLREFVGMENLCTMMLEQPDLVRDMIAFWTEFCSAVLARILEGVTPDEIHLSEDMAMKERPMIGPEMTRAFCAPAYRRWNEEVRAAGVPIYAIDSDGRIDLLIPVYMECGVNCVDPMEVAAGTDLVALRKTYGTRLAFRGGIDKRAIAAGGHVLEAELERLRPVIESGGYIPSCDHGVPPDISWANFQDYSMRLATLTGWL
ncbi:MAG TPA: uroporphyrinogen decarboxylase family protein [Candidatus Hydrogenedentes bacterium]|mgnify:CR=1 FL=1|nr:uroporphyrinogen decarboxylase family protein [Candidatus Hydrogenedentota bacterium]HPG67059.1 uroporphyrinogen decarboxylase family protein [Candidatus Hydrogenedentota bacterium]